MNTEAVQQFLLEAIKPNLQLGKIQDAIEDANRERLGLRLSKQNNKSPLTNPMRNSTSSRTCTKIGADMADLTMKLVELTRSPSRDVLPHSPAKSDAVSPLSVQMPPAVPTKSQEIEDTNPENPANPLNATGSETHCEIANEKQDDANSDKSAKSQHSDQSELEQHLLPSSQRGTGTMSGTNTSKDSEISNKRYITIDHTECVSDRTVNQDNAMLIEHLRATLDKLAAKDERIEVLRDEIKRLSKTNLSGAVNACPVPGDHQRVNTLELERQTIIGFFENQRTRDRLQFEQEMNVLKQQMAEKDRKFRVHTHGVQHNGALQEEYEKAQTQTFALSQKLGAALKEIDNLKMENRKLKDTMQRAMQESKEEMQMMKRNTDKWIEENSRFFGKSNQKKESPLQVTHHQNKKGNDNVVSPSVPTSNAMDPKQGEKEDDLEAKYLAALKFLGRREQFYKD